MWAVPALLATVALPAHAATIRVTDLITGFTTSLVDNALGDADPDTGEIVWTFDLNALSGGSVWDSVITIGLSKPAIGTPGSVAAMSVDVDARSSAAGRLLVEFSDTGFTLPSTKPYDAALSFDAAGDGGSTTLLNGSTSTAYFDASNTLFGTATTIGSPFVFACTCEVPDSDSAVDSDILPADADGLFALTHTILFDHAEAGLTQAAIDLELAPVPVPGGLVLMGSALAGFLASAKRRKAAH